MADGVETDADEEEEICGKDGVELLHCSVTIIGFFDLGGIGAKFSEVGLSWWA